MSELMILVLSVLLGVAVGIPLAMIFILLLEQVLAKADQMESLRPWRVFWSWRLPGSSRCGYAVFRDGVERMVLFCREPEANGRLLWVYGHPSVNTVSMEFVERGCQLRRTRAEAERDLMVVAMGGGVQ